MSRVITFKDVTNQNQLESVVNALFVGEDARSNTRKNAFIKNPKTGKYLEIDVWLPNRKLCFEFQDIYHYTTAFYSHVPLARVQSQDNIKRDVILQRGDTLVTVPCWWDGSKESLAATIQFQRPELCTYYTPAIIPINPPKEYLDSMAGSIPDVGKLMLASFPTSLSITFAIKTNWWVGEKYDGLRFCWHPENKTLYTRAGLPLHVQEPFLKHFPKTSVLDGELWLGRGQFQESQQLLSPVDNNILWNFFRSVVFDEPVPLKTISDPFEMRYQRLLENLLHTHPFITVAARFEARNKKLAIAASKSIVENGGEGVIMRSAFSLYEHGRSHNLLKLKAVRGDQEAYVTLVSPTDAVNLKLPSGATLTIPSTNVQVLTKLKRGDIVTISYDLLNRHGVPLNATIRRVREDVTWGEVLRRHAEECNERLYSDIIKKAMNTPTVLSPYWTSQSGQKMRAFFEKFARARKFDPLIAQNWYEVNLSDIIAAGGKHILVYFNWGLIKTLTHLFPEVKFEGSKFAIHPRRHWSSMGNRKKFFINFAKEKGFNPLVPNNWYIWKATDFIHRRGANAVLQYYQGNYTKALIHLFPDVPFTQQFSEGYWLDSHNRRKVLESYARREGFDPLIPENWFSAIASIRVSKDAEVINSMLKYYNGSLAKALSQLFPHIHFDETKFTKLKRAWHENAAQQREFFIDFAAKQKFDPLVAENWYSVLQSEIFMFQGTATAQLIASHYDGSLASALIILFPNIGLQAHKFSSLPREKRMFWSDQNRRREVLIDFARHHKFDPLIASNWEAYSKANLYEFKGQKDINSILNYHNTSLPQALVDLIPEFGVEAPHVTTTKSYWQEEQNRKYFFEKFAQQKGFNPLVADNWYSVLQGSLMTCKGASSIIGVHGTFKRALMELYPQIAWEPRKFRLY